MTIAGRYERNIKLIGEDGQRRLAAAAVLVIGAGGLGGPVLYNLAAAGVGVLGICDGDTVSASNLNRQILYTEADLDQPKVEMAAKRLRELNSEIEYRLYPEMFTARNAEALCREYDLIVDCLDNMQARLLLNDTCVRLGKPFIHGGIGEYYGQVMTVLPGGPCLRCVFPNVDEETTAFVGGSLAPTPGIVGSLQAMEAIKYLIGEPVQSSGPLFIDALNMEFNAVIVNANPDCICGRAIEGRQS